MKTVLKGVKTRIRVKLRLLCNQSLILWRKFKKLWWNRSKKKAKPGVVKISEGSQWPGSSWGRIGGVFIPPLIPPTSIAPTSIFQFYQNQITITPSRITPVWHFLHNTNLKSRTRESTSWVYYSLQYSTRAGCCGLLADAVRPDWLWNSKIHRRQRKSKNTRRTFSQVRNNFWVSNAIYVASVLRSAFIKVGY